MRYSGLYYWTQIQEIQWSVLLDADPAKVIYTSPINFPYPHLKCHIFLYSSLTNKWNSSVSTTCMTLLVMKRNTPLCQDSLVPMWVSFETSRVQSWQTAHESRLDISSLRYFLLVRIFLSGESFRKLKHKKLQFHTSLTQLNTLTLCIKDIQKITKI